MRNALFAFLMSVLPALVSPVNAADLNGRWWGEAVTDGRGQPVHVYLVQQGNILKGTGGPSATDQEVLANGKIEGKKIVFDIAPANRTPLHFELALDDDWTLKGSVRARRNGQVVTGQVVLRKRTD